MTGADEAGEMGIELFSGEIDLSGVDGVVVAGDSATVDKEDSDEGSGVSSSSLGGVGAAEVLALET